MLVISGGQTPLKSNLFCCETYANTISYYRRNDYISAVRDAAELALQQIGGDQVNRAMQMTKVLTAEIEELIKVNYRH